MNQTLNNRKWTSRQKRFIEWHALPERLRDPKTREDLAEALKVRPDTLTCWSRLPGFEEAVEALIYQHVKEKKPDLIEIAVQKALGGDFRFYKDIMAWFQECEKRYSSKGAVFTKEEITLTYQEVIAWEKASFSLDQDKVVSQDLDEQSRDPP